MHYKGQVRILLCLLLILPGSVLSSPSQSPETSQSRGRQIYLRGLDPGGQEIKATLGQAGTEVSASVVPCSSCHGLDGHGKAEGGVFPTAIRWPDLTRPYVVTTPSGRKHPAYNESLLVRAVTMGIDSAGNPLDGAMPRYQLSQQNARDLVAWLKELGAPDPGITDVSIEIGVFFSAEPRLAELNSSSRQALDAYFEEVNRNGGVYERQVILRYGEASDFSGRFDYAFKEYLKKNSPFALIDSYIAGAEEKAGKILEADGVPLIGATTLYPALHDPLNRYIFYLNSGVPGQAVALADYAEGKLLANGSTAVVLCSSEEPVRGIAESIHRRQQKVNWEVDVLEPLSGPGQLMGLISQLKRSRAPVFLLLCPPATMKQLLVAAASQGGLEHDISHPGVTGDSGSLRGGGGAKWARGVRRVPVALRLHSGGNGCLPQIGTGARAEFGTPGHPTGGAG